MASSCSRFGCDSQLTLLLGKQQAKHEDNGMWHQHAVPEGNEYHIRASCKHALVFMCKFLRDCLWNILALLLDL